MAFGWKKAVEVRAVRSCRGLGESGCQFTNMVILKCGDDLEEGRLKCRTKVSRERVSRLDCGCGLVHLDLDGTGNIICQLIARTRPDKDLRCMFVNHEDSISMFKDT
jgi:hypothetical protein